MENLMLEPLKFYENTAKALHEQNTREYFDELVKKSKVDEDANRKTVVKYKKQKKIVDGLDGKISKYKTLKGFMIFFIIASFLTAIIGLVAGEGLAKVLCPVIGCFVGVFLIILIVKKVNKIIKHTQELRQTENAKANALLEEAQAQMECLNALFTEFDTFNLIEKTMPNIKFNKNYDNNLQADFDKNYDFVNVIGYNRSVVDTVSGRLFENPFVFYRYLNHYIDSKTYFGSLVIHWTTVERDSNGRYRTVHHTDTLHASVVKPFPSYNYQTGLSYGNQMAPDLTFSRKAEHIERLSDKQIEKKVAKGEKKIKKKAEKSTKTGGEFTEMTNSEFDVLFGALDRDNEVQFRTLFSPLAQVNMVKLLRSQTGFGDDFYFEKRGRHNYIQSEHSQLWDMNTDGQNYCSYDIDDAKNKFITRNNDYFKSIFFDFAPLLTIPIYQQEPSLVFEPLKSGANYSGFEYEVVANAIGAEKFAPEGSATDVILKANYIRTKKKTDMVMINAQSYSAHPMVDYVPVFGPDGKTHLVPVPWIEYLPIEKNSVVAVRAVGTDRSDFISKANNKDVCEKIFDSPSAYLHGLFAKIVDNASDDEIDEVLNKIDNK